MEKKEYWIFKDFQNLCFLSLTARVTQVSWKIYREREQVFEKILYHSHLLYNIYIYIYIYSMNFLLQWLLTLFSPCYFDLVYNTWNYAPILNTSHSFKNFEKNILALQLFDGVSILNKNSVFFVFCLYYWGFFFLNFFNYLMPRLKQTLFLYLV